jgi:hypothetical protein
MLRHTSASCIRSLTSVNLNASVLILDHENDKLLRMVKVQKIKKTAVLSISKPIC